MALSGSIMSLPTGALNLPLVLLVFLRPHPLSCSDDAHAALRRNLRDLTPALCHLVMAQKDYVDHVFNRNFTEDNLDPVEGISIPVGNGSGEVRNSVCSIGCYLERHLPSIIRNVSLLHSERLIEHVEIFSRQFKDAVKLSAYRQFDRRDKCRRCPRRMTAADPHDYNLKERGLRIIYYTRKWVEDFTDSHPNWC